MSEFSVGDVDELDDLDLDVEAWTGPLKVDEDVDVVVGRLPDANVIAFLHHEAAVCDAHQYQQWLDLWHPSEGLYWVCGPGPCDSPADGYTHASVIFDNRGRLANRIRQLQTNKRHSQIPRSSLVRMLSNFREISPPGAPEIECWVNWNLSEFRNENMRYWAGTTLYRLQPAGNSYLIVEKRVVLINREGAINTFGFLV